MRSGYFRRWRFWLGLLMVGLVVWAGSLGGLISYINRRGCLSRANHDRIQVGMTEAQVSILLGEPPVVGEWRSLDGDYLRIWGEETSTSCAVWFDGNGTVIWKIDAGPSPNLLETVLEYVSRFGL